MRRLASLAVLLAAGIPLPADSPRFTNDDLAKAKEDAGAAPAAGVVTNDDLAKAEGNLSFTEPGDDVSYENQPARSPAAEKRERKREDRLAALKAPYKKLLREIEQIEEELPAAIDAAEREVGPGYMLVNGVPTAIVGRPYTDFEMPARERLQKLRSRLATARAELDEIEHEARQLGFGNAALVQR